MRDSTGTGVIATFRETPVAARYLLGGILVNQIGAFVQAFLVLYLIHEGMSSGQAGLALSTYGAGAVAGTLLGGELTHRIGARTTIACSMASSAVLVAAVPSSSEPDRLPLLLVVVALAGAVTQAYRPAAAAMLADVLPERHRIMGFSMLRIAMNIGAAVSPLLAAGLILVDWDLLFWFDGVTALAYAALALLLLPADRRGVADAPGQPGALTGRAAYARLARDRRFLVYLAAMLISSALYAQFTTLLPLALIDAGQPTAVYSGVLVLLSTIVIAAELKVTSYVQRRPATFAAGLGTALFALGLAASGPAAGSVVALGLVTVVSAAGVMISGPTMFAHAARTPAVVRARCIGVSQAMFGLGGAVGPAVGVLVWSTLAGGTWLVLALVGLVATVCAVVGVREPEPTHPPRDAALKASAAGTGA